MHRTSKVSEQVNRKFHIKTRFYSFQPPTVAYPLKSQPYNRYHLVNSLKHTVNKRTARISTAGVTIFNVRSALSQQQLGYLLGDWTNPVFN